MKTKRKNRFIITAVVILSVILLLPVISGLIIQNEQNKHIGGDDSVVKVDTKFECVECDISWADYTTGINLLSGSIVTNVEADRIFVNVNGYGSQDLEFDSYAVRLTDNSVGVGYTLSPKNRLLSTAFDDDVTVKIDIYMVYNDISYKVNSQNVRCKSCWIGPY